MIMNKNIFDTINRVYEALSDDKSKRVFLARLDYLFNGNKNKFFEWFLNENETICCPELDKYENGKQKKYIIFGAGLEGKRTHKILTASGRAVYAWCDNNRKLWGKNIGGSCVLSPGELLHTHNDATVIISVSRCLLDIYQQLLILGFPRQNIFIPENGFLLGTAGWQYFDVFEPEKQEVFIDAGCWNGMTTKEFVDWCKGDYNKIYAFEPDCICWQTCENTFEREHIMNVRLIKKGTWKTEGDLHFKGNGIGDSMILTEDISSALIPVTSIDRVLKGERVSFIKMDVEGSELETLSGGRESIQKYKPKLAVSVYHKPQDLWKLADYILEIHPDYKLFMRHYTTCNFETVLYAI